MKRVENIWGINQQSNWCCNVDRSQDFQLNSVRRNIIPKSTQRNEKTQKTSLKKRSGSNCSQRQQKSQTTHVGQLQHKQEQVPIKQGIQSRLVQRQHPVLIQHPRVVQTISLVPASCPPPVILHTHVPVNYIKQTPQKPPHQGNKMSFGYTKVTNFNNVPVRVQNFGVRNLQSFPQTYQPQRPLCYSQAMMPQPEIQFHQSQKKVYQDKKLLQTPIKADSKQKYGKTTSTSANQSQLRQPDSPLIQSARINQQKNKCYQSLNINHRQINPEAQSPGIRSERRPQININSLGSRKSTVLSIDGDSQSQQSFALMSLNQVAFIKYNSIQASNLVGQRPKFTHHTSLKNSMNL